jgi:hypothetical protein
VRDTLFGNGGNTSRLSQWRPEFSINLIKGKFTVGAEFNHCANQHGQRNADESPNK